MPTVQKVRKILFRPRLLDAFENFTSDLAQKIARLIKQSAEGDYTCMKMIQNNDPFVEFCI